MKNKFSFENLKVYIRPAENLSIYDEDESRKNRYFSSSAHVNLRNSSFKAGEVHQEALLFAGLMYSINKTWPKEAIFGLTNQLRRAAVSISLNIAEGSSRTKKDFRHFLDLSRGSCYESATILLIAKGLKYITVEQYLSYYEHLNKIARMTNALKRSLL